MTPGQARDIFYATARTDESWALVDKPVVQEELNLRCWQAVIDAVRYDVELEIAVKLAKKIEADAVSGQVP